MEDNIIFSCENIIVIPSKLVSNYSRVSWMSEYFNSKPGVVVLMSDTLIDRENLNNVNIIAYTVLIFKIKKVEIVKLSTTKVIQPSDILIGVLRYLLNFIKRIFYKSIVVRVDTSDVQQINFYIENNFIRMPQKSTTTKLYLVYNYVGNHRENNNIVLNTEIKSQLVKFPTSLAKILSSFVLLNYEVGGNICVDSIEQKNEEDVLVLGLKIDKVVKGERVNVSFPFSQFSPFSFHTHPDITIVVDSVMRYISWPSGLDIKTILDSFNNKVNLLAHFIATAEGVWVIYLSVAFQKFLSNLSIFYKNDLIDIIKNIGNIYAETEKYRTINFVDPLYRESIKNEFIEKSNTLTIKDLSSVQEKQYIGDNFFLFKLKLLPWEILKKDIILKFPYFINPEAGLPAKLSSTCKI